jgi:HK97 family phage portal protein
MRDAVRTWLAADQPNTITTSEELSKWLRFGGMDTASGMPVTIGTASGLAAVAICERVLGSDVAQLPLVVYRRTGDRQEPATDRPEYRVLHDRANLWQTSYQFRRLMMRDLMFRGNAYARRIRNSLGQVVELLRLHPDSVTPRQDARTLRVTYEHSRGDGTTTYRREDILHIWENPDTESGIMGLSPIRAHRESIGDGLAIRQHGSSFFKSSARLTGVLELKEGLKVNEPVAKQILSDFEQLYAGSEARRTALLPGGLSFKPVSISMEDAQWIDARKMASRDIFGIFGVPPHKGGDLERSTFNNVEAENISYVVNSLMSRLVCWEQALERDLFDNDPEFEVKFNVAGLLRGDYKSRQEGLAIQRSHGVLNADEWRALEDMNARTDPGGKVYLVQANMMVNDGKEAERAEKKPPPTRRQNDQNQDPPA